MTSDFGSVLLAFHFLLFRMSLISNPILNSPFLVPTRHFRFDDEGITNEILDGRRPSSHFVPIPRAKKKGKQLQFETEWTKDRIEPNPVVDRIRQRVGAWRQGGYVGVTGVTSRLLAYWTREERDKPLFFCQVEAVETAIYITEVARTYGVDRKRSARGERYVEPGASADGAEDGDGIRQDGRDGDAHRVAGTQQDRGSAGRAILRRVPDRRRSKRCPRLSAT